MASPLNGAKAEKPSFAKIAASGLKNTKIAQEPISTDALDLSNSSSNKDGRHVPTVTPSVPSQAALAAKQKPATPLSQGALREGSTVDANMLPIRVKSAAPIARLVAEMHPSSGMLLPNGSDDAGTQLSSSSGFVNPPSLDGKSVTSAATLGLDEKESLRPDDSASAKAHEEEDLFSPPGNSLPDSRSGSDDGVRAFREQLREISGMETGRRAGPMPTFGQIADAVPGVLYVPQDGLPAGTAPVTAHTAPVFNATTEVVPDPKLLEALDSPKDRIMVLKLEQDIADFVRDPKESSLKLPQTNAFYRMLAHRLADYYQLGHAVDESTQAVRIFKTPNCRVPPPLTDIATTPTSISTPPVGAQMKILRRGESAGPTIANGSNLPSLTASETGESGAEDDKRAKAPVTREEREARYEAARKRIMGSAKPLDSPEEPLSNKEMSRSSSTTGRRTSKKKQQQRTDSDDDFEARSAYSAYYPPTYSSAGPPTPSFGLPSYGPPSGGQMLPVTIGSQESSNPNYSQPHPLGQATWPSQPFHMQTAAPNWPQNQMQSPDLSSEFQRAMSFQTPVTAQSIHPQPFGMDFGLGYGGTQQPWPQQQFSMTNQTPPGNFGYTMPPFMNRPSSASSQPRENLPYAFGQLPSQTYPGRPPHKLEHPLPGSYKSKHFNPQSQSFVPNQGSMPNAGSHTSGGSQLGSQGLATNYSMPQSQFSNANISQSGSSNSPVATHPVASMIGGSNNNNNNNSGGNFARLATQPLTHPLPQPVFPQQPSPHVPLPPRPEAPQSHHQHQQPQHHNELRNSASTSNLSNANTSSSSAPAPQSTIAKWGMPASLPPKPPPSNEPFDAARFAQVHHGAAATMPGRKMNILPPFSPLAPRPSMASHMGMPHSQAAPLPRRP